MKRALLAVALIGLTVPGFAQEADDYHTGEVVLGLSRTDSDTASSKFLEYRDIPDGVSVPFFSFRGKEGDFRYDLRGGSVQEDDQNTTLKLEKGAFRFVVDHQKIPHNFGNDGRMILTETSPGVFEMSDTLQQSFQSSLRDINGSINYGSINGIVAPTVATANRVDLTLERERGKLAFSVTPEDQPYDVQLTYFRERRQGHRAASGTAFGFYNVVETPEPVHYITQDFGINASFHGSWGSARASVSFNDFENKIQTHAWDNPFAAVDGTGPVAYLGPANGRLDLPSWGLMALPPNNKATTASAGVTFKLPSRTRLTAQAALGSWTQDENPFIPYTTNTAITNADLATLPATKLDGKINTTSFAATLSSRPADKLSFNARFRVYDLSNDTPRISFPAYVRFDAVYEHIPRISVPYGFKNSRFDATLSYDLGAVTLEGGFKAVSTDRTFRETDSTSESGFRLAADARGADWAIFRASYETSSRDYDGLHIDRSEHSSFQDAEGITNLLAEEPTAVQDDGQPLCPAGTVCNLRYDQANKKADRIGASVSLTPGGNTSIVLSYLYTKDDYEETTYGLIEAKYNNLNAEVSYSPNDNTTLYAFFGHEKIDDFQRGRQSGGSLSTDPLADWTSTVADKVDSFGGGAFFNLVPDKWTLDLFARYQKVDGNNDLFSPPGGNPDTAEGIAEYDDTKLMTLKAALKYRHSEHWTFAVGGYFEDYEIADAQTDGIIFYMPSSFFLAADNADYQAKVGYATVAYRW